MTFTTPYKIAMLLTVILAAAAIYPAAGLAEANTDFTSNKDGTYAMVNTAGVVGVAYRAKKGCRGKSDQLLFKRTLATGAWTKAAPLIRKCDGSDVSDPSITYDQSSRRLIAVWSQTSVLKPKGNGIYAAVSGNKGRSWRTPVRLDALAKTLTPYPVSASARKGTLWVAYSKPGRKDFMKANFRVAGFSETSGRQLVSDLTKGRGQYQADLKTTAQNLHVQAAKGGLFVFWALADAGGLQRYYVADAKYGRSPKLRYAGALGRQVEDLPGTLTFAAGEDDSPYVMTNEIRADLETASAWSWNFGKHNFTKTVATQLIDRLSNNTLNPFNVHGFQVDKQGSVYILYTDQTAFPDSVASCYTLQWTCVRSRAPEEPRASIFVSKTDVNGKVTHATVPYPFYRQSSGDDVVQWLQGRSGLETVILINGKVRALARYGFQDMTRSGAIGTDSHYTVVATDPLTFS